MDHKTTMMHYGRRGGWTIRLYNDALWEEGRMDHKAL